MARKRRNVHAKSNGSDTADDRGERSRSASRSDQDGSDARGNIAHKSKAMSKEVRQPILLVSALVLTAAIAYMLYLNNATLKASLQELQAKLPSSLDELNLSFLTSKDKEDMQLSEQPGPRLARQGVLAKHPIILIPGFVTSALELWEGHECAKGSFRQRLWTHLKMAASLLSNNTCWMQHLSLNFTTGLDPDGIRLRAPQGLNAVDYFFPGYAVWAKAIAALAAIGYDDSTMVALPYDWRLSIPNMELRDAYFTRLRIQVEVFYKLYEEKVLIAAHSWGDNVARAFLHWMEDTTPGWVERHVAVLVNIAGTTLGTPKATTALLSGEMREYAQLHGLSHYLGEQLLSREARTLLWRTWGSSIGMLPHGGDAIWGNATWAPDDTDNVRALNQSYGAMLTVMHVPRPNSTNQWLKGRPTDLEAPATEPLTMTDAIAELVTDAGPVYLEHVQTWSAAPLPRNLSGVRGAFCPRHCDDDGNVLHIDVKPPDGGSQKEEDIRMFHFGPPAYGGRPMYPKHKERNTVPYYDALKTPLPNAPSLKLYCFYGYGIATERAYHYKHYNDDFTNEPKPDKREQESLLRNPGISQQQRSAGAAWEINRQADEAERGLENGVLYVDGDGTVPLLSLGGMCEGGWRTKKLNPHGVKVVTREYKNNMAFVFQGGDMRGGPEASAHVEILGNKHFLEDLLKAAAGLHDQITDDVGSDIHRIVGAIDIWDIQR